MTIRSLCRRFCLLLVGCLLLPACGPDGGDFEPNTSFWFKEKLKQESHPLRQDIQLDVAIIGGGYTGLSSAWHLATANPRLKIAIFEAKEIGSGASGRNGGMLLPGTESLDFEEDSAESKRLYDLTVASMHQLQALVNRTGIETDFKLTGYAEAILDEEEVDEYRDYVKTANRLGIPLQFWDARKTARKLGTDRYAGAVYDPNGGQVHAMKLVNALRKAVEEAGVMIYEQSPVTHIQEGPLITLKVSNHYTVKANSIVLATNAYTSRLGYFKNRVFPVHVQSAVTEPLTQAQLASLHWKSRIPFYDTRNILFHLILTPDNRIVIGGGHAEYRFNDGLTPPDDLSKVGRMMMKELTTLYPSLQGIRFDQVWNGVIAMTGDSREAVGVTGKYNNIYFALGYNGHGINLSFLFGDVIASLYQGKSHPWLNQQSQILPMWLPPEPLKTLGIKAVLYFYQWQDSIYNDRE